MKSDCTYTPRVRRLSRKNPISITGIRLVRHDTIRNASERSFIPKATREKSKSEDDVALSARTSFKNLERGRGTKKGVLSNPWACRKKLVGFTMAWFLIAFVASRYFRGGETPTDR